MSDLVRALARRCRDTAKPGYTLEHLFACPSVRRPKEVACAFSASTQG
jgi:hypothetical protein